MLYKGYVETRGKKSIEKLKGRTEFKTLQEVENLNGYGGILKDDTIMIDIDDGKQSEILMDIVDDLQLNCKVIQTQRGRHFLFKNTQIKSCRTKKVLAIGIEADIKVGSSLSYEVLKIDGEERFVEWDVEEGEDYQEVPKFLFPIGKSGVNDFISMKPGDGRNQALFNYILTLQSNDFTIEEARTAIKLLNKYVLPEALPEEELEVVLRDEAFEKPIFFVGRIFLFDKFATYIKNSARIAKVNNQLHIYKDGTYVCENRAIEAEMIAHIPNLRKTQRKEVIDYLELIVDEKEAANANYIAFENGIYNLVTDQLQSFDPELVVTNKIPWAYDANAYSALADDTLNKISCRDSQIRMLLEECIGYCFYRRNELGKAFILTGDKSNGKSTFLDCIKAILGEENFSALDLKELGDRFSTSMMFGKLANVGDDIGDDFLQGSQVSIFKKIVTGNRIKAERKGQDPFEFNPFIKLMFSANDIPRMRDKTGAVLRRLVIIPFNATFDKNSSDYDPFIKYKLVEHESIEYLIKLGIEGLKRVIANDGFSNSEKVQKQLDEYEEENNPIIGFIKEFGSYSIENEPTNEVYKRYELFCADNSLTPMSNVVFSKQINKRLGFTVVQRKINRKNVKIFIKE